MRSPSIPAPRKLVIAAALTLAAIAAGVFQLLPSVFLERSIRARGGEFLLTQVTHHGDVAIFYLPSAREILDGHFPPSELHVPAHRQHDLFLRPPGPTLLFAAFLKFADSENHAYMAAGFVMTIAMFLLFYWLGRELFGSRLGALFFAALGVLTPAAVHLPRAFFSPGLFADIIAKNFIPVVRTPILQLFLARIEDPLFTLWFYILSLLLLYRFFLGPSVKRALALGLAIGLLLYFYFYYWLVIVAMAVFLFGFNLGFARSSALRAWLIMWALVAILAIPYALNFIAFRQLPQASEIVARVGFEYGRGFRLSVWRDYLAYAALGVFTAFLLRHEVARKRVFWFSALGAMAALWNLQIVTGWNVQPDHWPKAFGLPLFALVAALVAAALSRLAPLQPSAPRLETRGEGGITNVGGKPRPFGRLVTGLALGCRVASLRLPLMVAAILLASLLGAKKIINAAFFLNPGQDWIADYSFPAPIAASWRWINQNAAPEAVVLSPSFITAVYLAGYTGTDPYLPTHNTLASNDEVEERFLTAHKLFSTPPEGLARILTYRSDPFSACHEPCGLHTALNLSKAPNFLYGQTFNVAMGRFDALKVERVNYSLPQEKMNELFERYRALSPRFEDFRGAYVYVGPWERELSNPDFRQNQNLELVYENELVEIYRIK